MTMSVVGGQPEKDTQIPVIKQLLLLGSLLAFFTSLVSREFFFYFQTFDTFVCSAFHPVFTSNCLRNVNKVSSNGDLPFNLQQQNTSNALF